MKNGSEPYSFLSALDLATLFYIALSAGYILVGWPELEGAPVYIAIRIAMVVFIFGLAWLARRVQDPVVHFVKNLYPLLPLSYFYAETSFLRHIVISGDLDNWLSQVECSIFGCQPSVEFIKAIPYGWFNEIMNLSYFSYYLLTAVVCITIYLKKREQSYREVFVVVFSFYLYYIIYAIIPVVGPKFYFTGNDAYVPRPYLFGRIMEYLLANGELPTGAFPSSHVGVALILAWVAWRHVRGLFYIIIPFVIGICFATVYLKEHYVLDVITGAVTVPLFIAISNFVYTRMAARLLPAAR